MERCVVVERGPEEWGRYRYVRVDGVCMSPSIREGWWVGLDAGRPAAPGDVVVVRDGQEMSVGALAEWLGERWIVSVQCPPRPLGAAIEIVGVVALVVQSV